MNLKAFLPDIIRQTLGFYRFWRPQELAWAFVAYSQFGEDLLIRSLFNHKPYGTYVDVGAYHPFLYSNTALLYKKGWRGVNVEPNPSQLKLFDKYRSRDANVNAAVSSESGTVRFEISDTTSKIVADHQERLPSQQFLSIPSRPLATILDEHQSMFREGIDLLTIDCEGHDIAVLRSNNWDRFRPRVVLVEDFEISEQSDIHQFMTARGYKMFSFLALTRVYVDPEFLATVRI